MVDTIAYFENNQAEIITCALYWLDDDIKRAGRWITAYSENIHVAMSHRIVDEDMRVKL